MTNRIASRFAIHIAMLAMTACASDAGDPRGREPEPTESQGQAVTLQPYVSFALQYSGSLQNGYIDYVDTRTGMLLAAMASDYVCEFQGSQGPMTGTEKVLLDIDGNNHWIYTVNVSGAAGGRQFFVACRARSLLSYSSPWSNTVSFGSTAAPGQVVNRTIWTDTGNLHTWCSLRGMQGPMLGNNDVSNVHQSGSSWILTTDNSASNTASRTSWAGCTSFSTPLVFTGPSIVNGTTHVASTNMGAGVCGFQVIYGGMGYLNSATFLEPYWETTNPNDLVNQLGGGSVWSSASTQCLWQTPF